MVQIRRKSFTGMLIACGLILLGVFISTTYNIDQITMFKWFGTFCLLIGLLPILLIILIPLWSYLMDSMDRLSVIINDRYSKSERFSILEKKIEKSKDKYRKKELIKSFTQKETLTLLNLTRLIHVSNLVDDEFWISLFISQISELEMTRRNCEYYGLFIKELKSDESRLKLKNSLASKGIKFDEDFYIRMDNREQKNRILKS
jgi:hypothetical protein